MLSSLGCAGLSAFELPELTMDVKGGFDSEYVYRGRKQGNQNFQLGFETGTEVLGGHLYAGAWGNLLTKDTILNVPATGDIPLMTNVAFSLNEAAPYIGYSYGITDMFMIDVGYIAHIYTNMKPLTQYFQNDYGQSGIARNTNEIYLGVAADVILSPKVYVSYDFDREEFCALANVGYSYDLGQFGWNNIAIEAKGEIGYDYAKRPYGIKRYFDAFAQEGGALARSKDYFFWGVGANLVYKYNEHAKVKAGVKYAGNGGSKTDWQNYFFGQHKNMCWFTSCVECSF